MQMCELHFKMIGIRKQSKNILKMWQEQVNILYNSSCPLQLTYVDCAVLLLPHCFISPLFSALFLSLFSPSGFEWHYSSPLYLLNSAAAALHAHTLTHFLRHKTMSAGRLFLAAHSSVYCMILAVLKENLCSHTYSVTLLLPLLSPPENWISAAVVPCDVPVPDKSLISLGACI